MSEMKIRTFLELAPKLSPQTSILLRANHGIGKSQLVRHLAKKMGLPVIDRRLSQLTEGDIIGLPSTDGDVTRFNPPDWYKRACDEAVVLFLDELNRATPEVMQTAFQIVLDRN
jgi:MoxR-like ATPase